MARPTSAPRLAKLQPERLAIEILNRVDRHLEQLAVALAPCRLVLERSGPELETELGRRTLALCAWAKDGHGDANAAAPLVDSVATAVYGRVFDAGALPAIALDRTIETDPQDWVELVVLAALARLRLARGEAVTPRELAVLAERTAHNVRHHIRESKLIAKRGLVAADEARRWLSEVREADRLGLERPLPLALGSTDRDEPERP